MPEPVDEEMRISLLIDEQPGSDKNSKSYEIATLKTPIIDTILTMLTHLWLMFPLQINQEVGFY